MQLRPRHLRARLTLWYVSVLAGLLLLAWLGTCSLLFWQLRGQLDRFAVEEIETVEGLFYFAPNGELRLREDYHNHPESKDVIERFLEGALRWPTAPASASSAACIRSMDTRCLSGWGTARSRSTPDSRLSCWPPC
jgi:hypothetical protein